MLRVNLASKACLVSVNLWLLGPRPYVPYLVFLDFEAIIFYSILQQKKNEIKDGQGPLRVPLDVVPSI